ncbi:MAG: hypothetical protein WD066_12240 [Planctomycetaceae bacterium]
MRAESNDLNRGDAWSRRRFLQTSGLAFGGLSLPGVSVGAQQEPTSAPPVVGGLRYAANWEVHVPLDRSTGNAAVNDDGEICVVGFVSHSTETLITVQAKIIQSIPQPTPDWDGATEVTPDTEPFGGAQCNFHFNGDDLVPGAEEGTENWLLLRAQFDSSGWSAARFINFKGVEIGHTDCEIAWFDSFTGNNGDPIVEHDGEITPLGYHGSDDWIIAAGSPKLAHGNHGAGTNAELYFDPGVIEFVAKHKVRIADSPTDEEDQGQMWATRAVRRQNGGNKWNWQIGHFRDGEDTFAFHELAKWEGGFASTEVMENLELEPGGDPYQCELTVVQGSISAKFHDEDPLVAASTDFAAETGQSFDAYYDIDPANLPEDRTAFSEVEITVAASRYQKSRAAQPGDVPERKRKYDELATVLCELDNTLSGSPSYARTWRPKGFFVGSKAAHLRWKSVVEVEPPDPDRDSVPIGFYVVYGDASDFTVGSALKAIDGDLDCVVLNKGMSKSKVDDRREKIKELLAKGGIGNVLPSDIDGKAAIEAITLKMDGHFKDLRTFRLRKALPPRIRALERLRDKAHAKGDKLTVARLTTRLDLLEKQCNAAGASSSDCKVKELPDAH